MFRRDAQQAGQPDFEGGNGLEIVIGGDGGVPEPRTESGARLEPIEGGGYELTLGEEEERHAEGPHDENLAECLPESVLNQISSDLFDGIANDLESRQDWQRAFIDGLELLGLKWEDRVVAASQVKLTGASFPLLMEAILNTQAQTYMEMCPPSGPARAQIYADEAPDMRGMAERKAGYMNYHLTKVDRSYYPDHDQMLFQWAFCGNGFKKVTRDPQKGTEVAIPIQADDLIVNYAATDFDNAGRITERQRYSPREMVQAQLDGVFTDRWQLNDAVEEEVTDIQQAINRIMGMSPPSTPGDERHIVFLSKCYIDIPVPGFEHVDDDGEPTGLPVPYRAYLHQDSRRIIGLYRDWKKGDQRHTRVREHVHYPFIPGFGFYHFGFVHILGAVAKGSTSILRQLIDKGSFNNFPAWLKAKGATRMESTQLVIGPGQVAEVDTMGNDIRASMIPVPNAPVDMALFEFFKVLVEAGRRLGTIMTTPMAEASAQQPVGTTLANIEQATKVLTAAQRRAHTAMDFELSLFAKGFAADPMARYPYRVDGKKGVAMAADFSDATDVVPVSDPNAPTKLHRLAIARDMASMAKQFPNVHDEREAVANVYEAMGVSQQTIMRVLPTKEQAQPMDAVSENMAATMGKPLRAGYNQDHVAHYIGHMAYSQTPGLDPMRAQMVVAHAQEHLAMYYRQQIELALGQPLPPLGTPLPPEIEQQIDFMTARVAEQVRQKLLAMAQQMAGQMGGPDKTAEVAMKTAELQYKELDSRRKADTASLQEKGEHERILVNTANDQADRASKEKIAEMNLERERIKAPIAHMRAGITAAKMLMPPKPAKPAASATK